MSPTMIRDTIIASATLPLACLGPIHLALGFYLETVVLIGIVAAQERIDGGRSA